MKTKLTLFLFAVFFAIGINLNAQSSKEDDPAMFFTLLEEEPRKAFDFVLETNKQDAKDISSIVNVISTFKNLLPLIGNYHGYEIVKEESIGTCLKRIDFLLKYEREPIKMTFVQYKAKNKWQVQDIKVNNIEMLSQKEF